MRPHRRPADIRLKARLVTPVDIRVPLSPTAVAADVIASTGADAHCHKQRFGTANYC